MTDATSILHVDVAGLSIFGRPAASKPPHGLYLGPDGIRGWMGGPDMRREKTQRPTAAGDFDAVGNLDSRVATFSGYCIAPSANEVEQLGERLTGLLADGSMGRVTVRHRGRTQFGQGRVTGSTQFDVRGRTPRIADWQLQMWFPDPRKYGDDRSQNMPAGDTVTIAQYGNYPATPELVVMGNMRFGYTVHGPMGRTYSVTAPVVPGTPHVIDLATGQVRIGGFVRYGVTTAADVWAIPPGVAVKHRLEPAEGTGQLFVNVKDTYI